MIMGLKIGDKVRATKTATPYYMAGEVYEITHVDSYGGFHFYNHVSTQHVSTMDTHDFVFVVPGVTAAPASEELLTLREIYERYGTGVLIQVGEQVAALYANDSYAALGFEFYDFMPLEMCPWAEIGDTSWNVLDYFPLDSNTSIGPCSCDFYSTILVTGCTCGAIKRYGETG